MNELYIRDDGYLSIGNDNDQRELGQIKVVMIEDMSKLQRISSSYFALPERFQNEARVMELGEFRISGRTLENANVSPVKEMITMIDSLRKFELSQRLMKMRDGLKNKEYQTFSS